MHLRKPQIGKRPLQNLDNPNNQTSTEIKCKPKFKASSRNPGRNLTPFKIFGTTSTTNLLFQLLFQFLVFSQCFLAGLDVVAQLFNSRS